MAFVIEKASVAFSLGSNEHFVIWSGNTDEISSLLATANLLHLDNITLATQTMEPSDAATSAKSPLSFSSGDEIQTRLLPHFLVGDAKFRFWLVFPDSTRIRCSASPRAVNATLLPINLGLGCKNSSRAKVSLAEAGDPVLEVTCIVSASGICQSVLFGAQPFVVEGDRFGTDNRQRFGALCLSLRDKDCALLAKPVAGCGRVALMPTTDGSRMIMRNVLTQELLLPLEAKTSGPEVTDASIDEALDFLDYTDYYDPLAEDGRIVALLNQRTQAMKRGRPKTIPPPTSHESKKAQGQGAKLLKKLQLPFSIYKP
jgi:hypothetical protein